MEYQQFWIWMLFVGLVANDAFALYQMHNKVLARVSEVEIKYSVLTPGGEADVVINWFTVVFISTLLNMFLTYYKVDKLTDLVFSSILFLLSIVSASIVMDYSRKVPDTVISGPDISASINKGDIDFTSAIGSIMCIVLAVVRLVHSVSEYRLSKKR